MQFFHLHDVGIFPHIECNFASLYVIITTHWVQFSQLFGNVSSHWMHRFEDFLHFVGMFPHIECSFLSIFENISLHWVQFFSLCGTISSYCFPSLRVNISSYLMQCFPSLRFESFLTMKKYLWKMKTFLGSLISPCTVSLISGVCIRRTRSRHRWRRTWRSAQTPHWVQIPSSFLSPIIL